VAKVRGFVIAYTNTKSNISDAFTKILEPKTFTRFVLWMANGLDDNFDKAIVAALEQLFQARGSKKECRMRDMVAEKKEKRELQRALDEQRAPAFGGVTASR
jgi:hypothetical protein